MGKECVNGGRGECVVSEWGRGAYGVGEGVSNKG